MSIRMKTMRNLLQGPIPNRNRYHDIADAMWNARHSLVIRRREKIGDASGVTTVVVNDALSLEMYDGRDFVRVVSSGHEEMLHSYVWHADWNDPVRTLFDAWDCSQWARMLRSMGLTDDIPRMRFGIHSDPSRAKRRWGDTTITGYSNPSSAVLHDRLDKAASDIVDRFSPQADAEGISVGDGLVAIRHYEYGILEHPEHGRTSTSRHLRAFHATAAAFRRLRERSFAIAVQQSPAIPPPALPALGNARESRMLQLCAVAIQRDPLLSDHNGTLLAPLIEKHVPELVERHREAARHALPQDLEDIDAQFSRGMDVVCGAIEEGLSSIRDRSHDDLRTQLSFLRSRHPSASERVA